MVKAGEPNHQDLQRMVREINATFAGKGVSFVYLPGDIADDGSREAYAAVRECLDQLALPWCSVVGDHDVHEKAFTNYQAAMGAQLTGSFLVGKVRFLRMNAFAVPRPDAFIVDDLQLDWLEQELRQAQTAAQTSVLLVHCYPSDLKQGGERLAKLVRKYRVRVVDMGHTHYNEVSNDGVTLYAATRSTGQIEEGPVGYSVLTLDGDVLSWQFARLSSLPLVSITSPSDERLLADAEAGLQAGAATDVHLRVWSASKVRSLTVEMNGQPLQVERGAADFAWYAQIPAGMLRDGVSQLHARAEDDAGNHGEDLVQLRVGPRTLVQHAAIDQDNAVGAWTDRDLLGTQLGPNKYGRKW